MPSALVFLYTKVNDQAAQLSREWEEEKKVTAQLWQALAKAQSNNEKQAAALHDLVEGMQEIRRVQEEQRMSILEIRQWMKGKKEG
ncbi:hypothetical protein C8J48_1873 [Desmospora activa DSM 45169]|uniref:Uncharacterized protein n=2 Tax=Desmospora TaxID=500614 RepID=A0A2T4ZBK2_9BACL|nr:hypothetical protein C8J48_1873 [Desmospora activa DSM 45169]